MNHKEKILYSIDKKEWGVEIGPSYNPITPKKEDFKVHIIDHLNKEELLNKYKNVNVNLNNIEEVDYVWRGESYLDLTKKPKFYNWIIASHLIERTPDFIGFFLDCDAILKNNGVISLVVPDKRYCFDHHRPITGISKIIDSHLQKNKLHTPGSMVEHYLYHTKQSESITWAPGVDGQYSLSHTIEDALSAMDLAINSKI